MTAAQSEPRTRRVGTFTLGLTLVAAGGAMLASLLLPRTDLGWMLKAAPLILISLGVETLLAARGGGKVKYDWLGMLLTFLLAGAGLALCAAAWAWENQVYFNGYNCSRFADEETYRMEYQFFSGFDSHVLYLEAGDTLEWSGDAHEGWIEVEISREEDGVTVLENTALWEGQSVLPISKTGRYLIEVYGRGARGSFVFRRVPAPEAEGAGLDAAEMEYPPEPEAPPALKETTDEMP